MDATLAGHPWLPRMIDKARAARADTLGTYYRYPCPIDTACLALLGIDANTFLEIAYLADDDHDVVDMLATIDAGAERLEGFDPVGLNAQAHRGES